ncbi:MAG: hypothetical protein KTR28_00300 [Micavibrio sp.]|nr:hypothetical protein [Micavibrio sp.]
MKLKYLLYSACFGAFLVPSTAFADWSANFVPPTSATTPMRIDLPDDLDIMTLTTLGVELDGTDITAMLSLDGEDFVYTPVQALSGGEHTIRLVDLGTGENKGAWSFSIDGSAAVAEPGEAGEPSAAQIAQAESWLRGGSVEIDTLTEASDRTFDNLEGTPPNSSIISGAGDLNANAYGENWEVNARANYLVQSDHNLALTGNTVDLGEYDISADYTGDRMKGGVTLGHHDIGVESNLFSGFYRRGASARLGTSDERVMAQGFAFRPESVSGARDFTGLNDNEDRLEGFMTSFKPFSNDSDALKVTGIYYDGRGDDGGTGTALTDVSSTGSGWGTILEKSFGQGRVTMRGEYSQATFDVDGGNATADEDTSDAITLAIEGRPFQQNPVFMGKSADIVIGARYDRIGTFYESLANEGLASDRSAVSAYSNLYWGALSGNLQFLHETNNVDDLASAPTDRLRNASLNLSYSFDPQTGPKSWLGTPYLNFSGFVADFDRMDTPTGYTGFDTNNVSDSMTFGGGSNYNEWYWSASHTVSEYEDHANASNDTVNNFTSLNAGWSVNERLNLDGGVSFGAFRDEDAATSNYDTNLNLGVDAIIISDKLDLNFDYNLNLASGSGDTPDRHIVNSEAEYTVLQPSRNRPGLALALRGSMEDTHASTTTENETQYQVYTVLRVKAPFGFGF